MEKNDLRISFLTAVASYTAGEGLQGEFISQLIASAILAGDLKLEEAMEYQSDIDSRTLHLVMNENEIWDGLMPGPGDPEQAKLMEGIEELLYTGPTSDEADPWTYSVEFWVGDEKVDTIKLHEESILNLASQVSNHINALDGGGEMYAVIELCNQDSDDTYLMARDDAEMITMLNATSDRWDNWTDGRIDLYMTDVFQTISDSLAHAGQQWRMMRKYTP